MGYVILKDGLKLDLIKVFVIKNMFKFVCIFEVFILFGFINYFLRFFLKFLDLLVLLREFIIG